MDVIKQSTWLRAAFQSDAVALVERGRYGHSDRSGMHSVVLPLHHRRRGTTLAGSPNSDAFGAGNDVAAHHKICRGVCDRLWSTKVKMKKEKKNEKNTNIQKMTQ